MRYALSASFSAPWDATPVVAIDMEFRYAHGVGLLPADDRSNGRGVEIIEILFDERDLDERAKAERLLAAGGGGVRATGRP